VRSGARHCLCRNKAGPGGAAGDRHDLPAYSAVRNVQSKKIPDVGKASSAHRCCRPWSPSVASWPRR
jgi:hypothetical protein